MTKEAKEKLEQQYAELACKIGDIDVAVELLLATKDVLMTQAKTLHKQARTPLEV